MERASQSELLLAAAKTGDLEQVRELIDGGAALDGAERWKMTALAAAANKGHLDVVSFLIGQGANVNKDSGGLQPQTPLAHAAQGGDLAIARCLIDHGADVNAVRSGDWTPMISAAAFGQVHMAQYLADCGADVNMADIAGQTPLHLAALNGHLATVQILIDLGADLDAAGEFGDTPLIIAAEAGHQDIVDCLVSHGADLNASECSGWTATTKAAIRGHLHVLQYLVDCGGDAHASAGFGNTTLMSAAQQGHFDIVQYLCETGGDINAADGHGDTPLSFAARSGHLAMVQFLVERGAKVDTTGIWQRSPMMMAAMDGHADVVRYLAACGADTRTRDKDERTPLACAAGGGCLDVVRALANCGEALDVVDKQGQTPLMSAAMGGHLDMVQCLVERRVDVNAADNEGHTAVTLAASRGHLEVMLYLTDHGAIANWNSDTGRASMVLTAANGHLVVMEHLLASGLDINISDQEGKTLLSAAAANNRLKIVELLTNQGADVNLAQGDGKTPLMCAATRGHLAVCHLLVDHGADVNGVDTEGSTALASATKARQEDVALFLVECGASVSAEDCNGWTPLIYAANHCLEDLSRRLIERNADVNAAAKDGATALIFAAMNGHSRIIQLLINSGADVNATTDSGLTALICATIRGYKDCVKHLIECGADPNAVTSDGDTVISLATTYNHQDIRRLLLRHVGRSRPDLVEGGKAASSLDYRSSAWFVSPFEVELVQYVETGNVGGEFRAVWLDTDVAVKLFTPDASSSSFLEEVGIWHQLRHPNIIKLYGACIVGHTFFVCEYASNGAVTDYLRTCKLEDWRPWRFAHQAALGLAYLHERKMVHGNLCGSNILVGSDGLTKLAGFEWSGTARDADTGAVVVSRRWHAPERVRGGAATFASDVYSLGMCIIAMITGKIPWEGYADSRIQSGEWDPASDDVVMDVLGPASIPWALRDLIRRACSRDPARRATSASIAQALNRLAAQDQPRKGLNQPEPESRSEWDTFKHGDMTRLWSKIDQLMQSSTSIVPQQRVFHELEALTDKLKQSTQPSRILQRYHDLLADFHDAIQASLLTTRILRLSSTRATGESMIAYQHRIQDLWTMLGDSKDAATALKPSVPEQHAATHLELFVSEVSKTYLVLSQLESDDERQAFLALLKAEIDVHASSYSADQLEIMQQAHDDISKATGASGDASTPPWFVPWFELSNWKWLGEGGFGDVFVAKWLDSEVVVKQMKKTDKSSTVASSVPHSWASTAPVSTTSATVETSTTRAKREEARSMFQREVAIWFRLSHPHIVRLFGACHVGTPFFVCEYAVNRSLDKYLKRYPELIWQKLREAALGVQYLHERGVVHGDLKCNNVVVGSDLKAKVTDFGLSSGDTDPQDGDGSTHKTGAWHWVAPECLADEAAKPTFASDVFAFGMCIVEAQRVVESPLEGDTPALRSTLPWLTTDNIVVKYHATRGKLPPRPRTCTDSQWTLVESMCRFQPSDRIKMCTVVDELSDLAKTGLEEADPTKEGAHHELVEPLESVVDATDEMHALFHGREQDNAAAPDSRQVLLRVHKLLWNRLAHLSGLLDADLVRSKAFQLLVESAKARAEDADECSDALAQLTELALHAYALHRRLDKFLVANLVKISEDDDRDGVHKWQSKCYAFLGVITDEERLVPGDQHP